MESLVAIVLAIGAIIAAVLGWGKLKQNQGRREKEREQEVAGINELAKRDRDKRENAIRLAKKKQAIEEETARRVAEINSGPVVVSPRAAEALRRRSSQETVESLIADALGEGSDDGN